jgi:predicted GNAT superfamily acetyltransferase
MSRAYGEMRPQNNTTANVLKGNNNHRNTHGNLDPSKMSHLANSISGFYKERDGIPDGLSTNMKESEVARKIPNFKDKRFNNLKRRDS